MLFKLYKIVSEKYNIKYLTFSLCVKLNVSYVVLIKKYSQIVVTTDDYDINLQLLQIYESD